MIVYLITNIVNGKRYVGQSSKTVEGRWKDHTSDRKGTGCTYLKKAINKYGSKSFVLKTLLFVATKNEADYYEKGLIKALNTKAPCGYNLTEGGEGGTGYIFTDEQRKKISLGITGRPMPSLARKKLLERNAGNKFSQGVLMSEEHRLKLIAINTGSKRTPEQLQKQIESHTGLKHTPETKKKMSDRARITMHIRFHVDRNKQHPKCSLCLEAQNVAATDATSPS